MNIDKLHSSYPPLFKLGYHKFVVVQFFICEKWLFTTAYSYLFNQSLLEMLKEIEDPMKGNAIKHNLDEILMIGILAIISNGDTYVDMELFGKTHEDILNQFLELPNDSIT